MDKPMSNLSFKGMCLLLKIRDWLRPREEILQDVNIEPGCQMLDFGCGPGSYRGSSQVKGNHDRRYTL